MENDTLTLDQIVIPSTAKVKVYWDDRPENYSKEAKTKVRNHFAKKFGINSGNINVQFRPIKVNEKGDVVEITGAGIENIMDITYQRALMKEVISRDGKVVDFERIIALDNLVNGELNVDLTASQHRAWSIKWLMVDNFLSFGANNYVPFGKMKGLTVVNSVPANQGGKTTFTIDAIKFLLHGTTTKTDKNEQIFNTYSGKNEVTVRGMIDIEGDEFIIERKMKRTASKTGEWKVSNKLSYYKLLPDGTEEEKNEEDAKQTTKKIKETIGTEKDFELLVLATEKTLDDLVGLTTTESGKVLTRLIGLEILELKEAAVRKMYNEFNTKKKSNNYDVITLANEIEEHNTKVVEYTDLDIVLNTKLSDTKIEIARLNTANDTLINSKEKIDVTIAELNPSKLEVDIATITAKGVALKANIATIKASIDEIGEVVFDEDRHHAITKELSADTSLKAVKEAEVSRLKKVIDGLIAGGICQSCNRKLDDVDNSAHIAKHTSDMSLLSAEILVLGSKILGINTELSELAKTKLLIDAKNKHELDISRIEVEMGSLRNQIVAKNNDLKKYNLNLSAIELNKNIDIEISQVKTNLVVCEHTKDETISRIQRVTNDLQTNKTEILTKTNLIATLKKEEEIEKIFKIYIDLVGKKGISKLVLRSVLPIINSEVARLLDEVTDFEIEIFMDDKNDVQFLIVNDGVSKLLKSGSGLEKTAASLALRAILGKISTLPMPNFITFDEVLGKVADENLEKLKSLFDKIKDMYDIVFLITHNALVKDWGDNIVTVNKINHLSEIKLS
jgi:hypothetical protein